MLRKLNIGFGEIFFLSPCLKGCSHVQRPPPPYTHTHTPLFLSVEAEKPFVGNFVCDTICIDAKKELFRFYLSHP